jgi:hypothetical protein
MTTIDLRPVRDLHLDTADWAVEARVPLHRRIVKRVLAVREIGLLTLVALVGYIATAFWMFYVKHFYINDELNRTADAVYVTIGRDPHLGAIGFYWPPLPQLLNCLFVPILEPFGRTVMAGPVETAFCMAFTIPVLAKIGKSLGVGRWTTFAICLVFAVTPVAIYNSSNGMSEAAFFLTGSLTMLGFLRYIRSRSTGDMILFSLAMCSFILTRLEGPFIVVVLVVVASFEWSNLRSRKSLRQSAWNAVILAAPPLACLGFWVLVQWILLKDALYFLQQGGGSPPRAAAWLPNPSTEPWGSLEWAARWVVVLGIPLVIALFWVILRPRSDRTRGSIGIIGATGTILAIQIWSVGFEGGWGDPRYFSMIVPFGAVAALWLAARSHDSYGLRGPSAPPWVGHAWNVGLIAVLLVNAGTGNWYMSSGQVTAIEHECTFFQGAVGRAIPFLGRGGGNAKSANYCAPLPNTLSAYQDIDTILDHRLKPDQRVLTDNSTIFAPDLFTDHPGQFIVRNDRDWEKIVANPVGKVTYIITVSKNPRGRPQGGAVITGSGAFDYGAQLVNLTPMAWKLVAESTGDVPKKDHPAWVQLYEISGTVPPAGINGPTGE